MFCWNNWQKIESDRSESWCQRILHRCDLIWSEREILSTFSHQKCQEWLYGPDICDQWSLLFFLGGGGGGKKPKCLHRLINSPSAKLRTAFSSTTSDDGSCDGLFGRCSIHNAMFRLSFIRPSVGLTCFLCVSIPYDSVGLFVGYIALPVFFLPEFSQPYHLASLYRVHAPVKCTATRLWCTRT